MIDTYVEAMKRVKPDMVICDIISQFGIKAADQLDIPVMIQVSLPFVNAENLTRSMMLLRDRIWKTPFGCLCIAPIFIDAGTTYWRNVRCTPETVRL